MFFKFYLWIRRYLLKLDDRSPLEIAISNGLIIGKNHNIQGGCIIDPSHCFLITIGDNVTLAPRVHILAHDASTKYHLGYTRIGKVYIGNNVFIGANSTILPNVRIGDNVIIGAGSVVSRSIPANSVAAGNPARIISDISEYLNKHKNQMKTHPCYDEAYIITNITTEKKIKMQNELNTVGYIV